MIETFSIGRVFSRMFGLIKNNFANVGVFILIIWAITAAANFLMLSQMTQVMHSVSTESGGITSTSSSVSKSYGAYNIIALIAALIGLIGSTGAIYGYMMSDDMTKPTIGQCFAAGLKKFLPYLGLSILWILGVEFGLIFFIVPGLILLTMWSVAAPALIGENSGVFGSFGRSRALTKGLRWNIFGLLLIVGIILYGIIGVTMAFAMGPFFAAIRAQQVAQQTGLASSVNPTEMMAQMMTNMIPMSTISGLFFAFLLPALLVSLYREVRLVKEGDGPRNLREVFA